MIRRSEPAYRARGLAAAWALSLLLAACAGLAPETRDARDPLRQQIMFEALGQLGQPYRYGGADPQGFDCSGLVQYSFAQAGVRLPRTAAEQRSAGREVDLAALLPGDLLFYRFPDKQRGGLHVAIYVDEGRIVHAPARSRSVSIARVDNNYWQARFIGAVDVLDR